MTHFTQRIGSKSMMISDYPENPNFCYKWTKGNSKKYADGSERYVCSGCRSLRDRKIVPSTRSLPARKVRGTTWLDEEVI